jgi:hypothetical protein
MGLGDRPFFVFFPGSFFVLHHLSSGLDSTPKSAAFNRPGNGLGGARGETTLSEDDHRRHVGHSLEGKARAWPEEET